MTSIFNNSAKIIKRLVIVVCLSAITVLAAKTPATPEIEQIISDFRLKTSPAAVSTYANWTKSKSIVVRVDSDERLKWLQSAVPDVKLIGVNSYAEALSEITQADGVMGFCSDEIVTKSSSLKWIQTYTVGVDRCVSEVLISCNIILTNGQRLSGPNIAEHAIALMTTLTRGLDAYHIKQLSREWDRSVLPGADTIWELEGRTMLVVGLGGIGTEVAKRGHGLGMRVIATRNSRREGPDFVSYVGLADELNELAKQADVVVNALPLTPATEGVFNKAFFDAMPSHAYFVSIGRGKSTVTDDLVSALKNGDIAGAGLDVTDPEPLPTDHALWTMPRVLITPHIAWRSEKYVARRWIVMRENLRRYVNGEALLSEVDLDKGY